MEVQIARDIRHDLPAGIVVLFVAVPLCLGIALASGAPLFSGLIAGIVGGRHAASDGITDRQRSHRIHRERLPATSEGTR